MKMFSGIKDVDRLIVEKLDDRDLLTMCNTSLYCNTIADDSFFRGRSLSKFPQESLSKPNYIKWKPYYATLVYIKSEKDKICEKIKELIEERKINKNTYYLATFDLNNSDFNYFIDKFVEGYHTDIPNYFEITYRKYIQKGKLGDNFSPNREITGKEVETIKDMLNKNLITNTKLSPDIVKFVNKQIYINLLPYNILIKDICK